MSSWVQTLYQESLERTLHGIFPRYKILSNTRKEGAMTYPQTGGYLEVDVWLPELNMCFEFQDFYHYTSSWYNQIPLEVIQQKDYTKRGMLMKGEQTLIVIPCWWSGDALSLQATIHFQRPDLEQGQINTEISGNPPVNFFEEYINQCHLMLASFPSPNVIESKSWWIGEKWDGIRCFWDTAEKQLYSRNKIRLGYLSAQLGRWFGAVTMDAELWSGRGCFYETQSIVVESLGISQLRLLCFDITVRTTEFESRYALLLSHIHSDHPFIINATRMMSESDATLQNALYNITEGGGEGVVLRKPGSYYLPGRSDSLFKIKALNMGTDQEGLVIRSEGNNSGLLVQMSNGYPQYIPKTDILLHRHAVPGDIVTVGSYSNTTTASTEMDCARPVVYRIRSDLSWRDVVHNLSDPNSLSPRTASPDSRDLSDCEPLHRVLPRNHGPSNIPSQILHQVCPQELVSKNSWHERVRVSLFDKFASAQGMDSLNPIFWYNTTREDLVSFNKGYKSISKYRGKLSTILMQVYPDIGLKRSQFKVRESHWTQQKIRRSLFDKFATSKGMDSLNPIFWHHVTPKQLISYDQGYLSISRNHGGKLSAILMRVYPNIGLLENQFKVNRPPQTHERIKQFLFDPFAASKGMDPLNPIFWYNTTHAELIKFNKKYYAISRHHRNNLSTVLMQVYPQIGLLQN